jgi:cathepsin B
MDLIEHVNSVQSSWKAGINENFAGMTLGQVKAMMGVLPREQPALDLPVVSYPNFVADDEFDGYKVWGKCAHAIRNQGHCGSCWAFGASEALSDRQCIEEGNDVVLSAQNLVSCDTGNMGCNGGWLDVAWKYMDRSGLVPDSCYPYTSGDSGDTGKCQSSCTGSGDWVAYHATGVHQVARQESSIRAEVQQFGPAEVAFSVYRDFLSYKSGVYHHTSGELLGGHAVKLMGWGSDSGTDYWLIANSWGEEWGDGGKFKIKRGVNECGIEGDVIVGKSHGHS